jgi:hypothetical protein
MHLVKAVQPFKTQGHYKRRLYGSVRKFSSFLITSGSEKVIVSWLYISPGCDWRMKYLLV